MFPCFVPQKYVDLCFVFWRGRFVIGSITKNQKILSKTMCRLLCEELEGISEDERVADFLQWARSLLES